MQDHLEQTGGKSVQESDNTRREVLAHGALLSVGALGAAGFVGGCATPAANAQEQMNMQANVQTGGQTNEQGGGGERLYDRLGGIFPIAAVVDYFSDQIIEDPVAGARSANPQLRAWHTQHLDRLPGLKFMRTLWVAAAAGGPFQYAPVRPGSTNLGLENAHRDLRISPTEFDAVAGVLSRSLDHFNVPAREKSEVLGAFAAHKDEVTRGWREAQRG
jgi:hemoglobin